METFIWFLIDQELINFLGHYEQFIVTPLKRES